MSRTKTLPIVLGVVVLLMTGLVVYSSMQWQVAQNTGRTTIKLGAPFELVSDRGDIVTEKTIQAKPHLMIFGYTHCPDVCPTSLYEAAGWLKALGEDADKLQIYFVTVDPKRDTKELLNEFIDAFDNRIIGLTGEEKNLYPMLKAYSIYYKKVIDADEPSEYLMDHSASIYLIKKGGDFFDLITYGSKSEVALEKIRKLLKTS
jgi:protein SCO1/2